MTDWYKIKRVLTWVNWEEKQIRPIQPKYNIDISNIESSTAYSVNWSTWLWGIYSIDGKKFFWSNRSSWVVWKELSTPFNLGTITQSYSENPWWDVHQVFMSWDWTKVAFSSYWWYIGMWTLTTPRDFTTRTNYKTKTASRAVWVSFNKDGTMLYICYYQNSNSIIQYSLAIPRDITSTATQVWTLSTWYESRWVSFSSDWLNLLNGVSSSTLYQYRLSTPRDITTATQYKSVSAWVNCWNILLDDSWYVSNTPNSSSSLTLYRFYPV